MHPNVIFPPDESVATRLGARDLIVKLDRVRGPFGSPIRTLAIPHYWCRVRIDFEQNTDPENVISRDGTISFEIQNARFSYDRYGLRREQCTIF